jgi:hypothetical protein
MLSNNYNIANTGSPNPIKYHLTSRGFFSEVNNLLNAIAFALVKRRRLIADETTFGFGDYRWLDFFTTKLPTLQAGESVSIIPDWEICDGMSKSFHAIRRSVNRWHRLRLPFYIPRIGFFLNYFRLKREIARHFCATISKPEISFLPKEYAAFHIRKGDKVEGYDSANGKVIEGEDRPIHEYLSFLHRLAPNLKNVFVMTDDFQVIEELRNTAKTIRFETLCESNEKGYHQSKFDWLDKKGKINSLIRLLAEVDIAINSKLFLGCYKSNVSRHIALTHKYPYNCHSIDSQKRWDPL